MKHNSNFVKRVVMLAVAALAAMTVGTGLAHAADPVTWTPDESGNPANGTLTIGPLEDIGGTTLAAGGKTVKISVAGVTTEVTVPLVSIEVPGAHDLSLIYKQASAVSAPQVVPSTACAEGDGFDLKVGASAGSGTTTRSLFASGTLFAAGEAVPFSQQLLDMSTTAGTPDLGYYDVLAICIT